MSQLPNEIEVIATGERVRYRLPRPTFDIRGVSYRLFYFLVGLTIFAGGVVSLANLPTIDRVGWFRVVGEIWNSLPRLACLTGALICLWPIVGRIEVELTPKRLRCIARVGPFWLSRRRSRSDIRKLSVVASKRGNSNYRLQAECESRKPMLLVVGPRELLASLAEDLAERIGCLHSDEPPQENRPRLQPAVPSTVSKDAHQGGGCVAIFLVLFSFPWFAVGCALLNVVFLVPLYRSVVAINWHATPCTITSSGVDRRDVSIVYVYDFGGRQYQSDRYDFNEGVEGTRTERRINAIRGRYQPGEQVTCYVKPSDPGQAVINRRFNPSILPSFFSLISLNIGLFAMNYGWRLLRGKRTMGMPSLRSLSRSTSPLLAEEQFRDPEADQERRERPSGSLSDLRRDPAGVTIAIAPVGLVRGNGGWFGFLVTALWILVIIPLSMVVLHGALTGNLAEQGFWSLLILIPCAAVIFCALYALHVGRLRAELTVRNGALTIRQSGLFGRHEKQWGAHDLANVRVTPLGYASKHSQNQQRTDGPWQLEIASKDGTSRTFLTHRDQSELEWIAAELRDALWLHKQETGDWLPNPKVDSGPKGSLDGSVTLRPDTSSTGNLVRNSLFALFWNGILAFNVQGTVNSFLKGRPDWNLAFWLLPFALIGLYLVCRMGNSFLALFGPRPTITLSTASVALGDTVEVRWHFSRNTSSLRGLDIYLWGEEKTQVPCGNGERRRTVTESFAELPVIESAIAIPSGKAQMTVPENSMHSFKADHNEIIWSVEVFADVWFWPDVAVGFPIVVLPQRITTETASHERAEN